MIIFLYGPDSYRSRKKLGEIIDHYKESNKSGLNLVYLDASQTDFEDFYNNFKVSSMFSEKKLIIISNLFSKKVFQEGFLDNLKSIESLKDAVVVYQEDFVDERTKIFKTLKKECKSQEFKLLDSKNLRAWAEEEFQKNKSKINVDAMNTLLMYAGNNLWSLSNEIKKLSDFKQGSVIRKEDVELQVKPRIEVDIFKTIDSLADKDKKTAFLLLKKHLNNGDNAIYLFSMLAYQFRNLLVVKELADSGLMYNSIVKKSGLHPFVVKKNYFQARNFNMEELKRIYKKIFQIDLEIKTGRVEPETALDLLVSSI